MKRKEDKKDITTIAVSIADNQRITQHCDSLSIPKKDFIPIILDFLENNGINPKTDHAPKTELAQIKKRIDQFFGFIKTQDKEYLRPMLEAIQATENRLQNKIANLVEKDNIKELPSEEILVQVVLKTLSLCNEHIDKKTAEIVKNNNVKNTHLENRLERMEVIINHIWEKQNEKKSIFKR